MRASFVRLIPVFWILSQVGLASGTGDGPPPAVAKNRLFDLSSLPVFFEKDPHSARFQTRTDGGGVLLERRGLRLRSEPSGDQIEIGFRDARKDADPSGEQLLPGYSNYFVGNDPSLWSVKRPHYNGVRYDSLWPGIDLVFYAQHRRLEYDFKVAPQADPGRIRLSIQGAQSVAIDEQGNLWIATASGKVKQLSPVLYQEIDGKRVSVAGGYRVTGKNQLAFWLGSYDPSRPLVIDPVLEFATYLGGPGWDYAHGIAVDSSNNIYVAGYTQLADFFSTPPTAKLAASAVTVGPNVFLVKLDAVTRQIDYLDYYGGSTYELASALAVDSTGAATVVGQTNSTNLPLVNATITSPVGMSEAGYAYGFAAHFSADGTHLLYSTYTAPAYLLTSYGGAFGVAADSSGGAYVVGETTCFTEQATSQYSFLDQFQPTANAQQRTCTYDQYEFGYIIHFSSTGSELYASYYAPAQGVGGTNYLNAVTVDSQGFVYTAGTILGTNVVNRLGTNAYNVICNVTKFSLAMAPLWNETLGGSKDQECVAIGADPSANIYVTGYTDSQDFPATSGSFQRTIGSTGSVPNVDDNPLGTTTSLPLLDGFAAKYDTNGNLKYSTYLGGVGDDYGNGIAVTSAGTAYITGYTSSLNFPVTPGAYQTGYGGGSSDAFVAGVSSDGTQLVYSTFFGGSGQDEGDTVAVDQLGNVYMAGSTESTDLPLTADALQRTVKEADAMIAKFNLEACNPTMVVANPLLNASAGSTTMSLTTDTQGCPWTLSTTAPWLLVNPSSGNGNATVTLNVASNGTGQSRLAIVTANSRRTFVYQAAQTACQYVFSPGEMALSASSAVEPVGIQATSAACAWTAASNVTWLHILSTPSGTGNGSITIGTDPNTLSAVRTGTLTIGGQILTVSQSAGANCSINVSSGDNTFGPAGGIGTVNVLTSSSQCSWQAQTNMPSWIVLPSTATAANYGNGRVRFSVETNNTGSTRTGTVSVGSQSVTVTQNPVFTTIGSAVSGSSTTGGQAASPLIAALKPPKPRGTFACASQLSSSSVTLDPNGDPQTLTITRNSSSCGSVSITPHANSFLSTPTQTPSGNNITLTFSAAPNPNSQPLNSPVLVTTIDSNVPNGGWTIQVTQSGAATAPLAIVTPEELTPTANSDAVTINSTNNNPCTWAVDPNSVPTWVTLTSTTGQCQSQLAFNYTSNTTNGTRTAKLAFLTGEQLELDQPPPAPTACTETFSQTAPQNVAGTGGPVTFNVNASASSCTWTADTDSPGWVTFPSPGGGTGSASLPVQVTANNTTSPRTAQIIVNGAIAYVSEAAGTFPSTCQYSISPTSNAFPNTGGSFTFSVQTTSACSWQPTQPPADTSYVHITSSTAVQTGNGSVSFTVDPNPAGSAARSSSITVAGGVSFSISEAAGSSPACTYSISPSNASFTGAGGSSSFSVTTQSNCSWQPTQPPADTSYVHITQPTTSVTGSGTVNFTVAANPGSSQRSSTIAVGTATFALTEAGSISAVVPTFTASNVQNAASYVSGGVAPGEFIAITNGSNLGPAQLAYTTVSGNGLFGTTAGGTQVLFDGRPAAMYYSLAGQVAAIVPYEVAGQTSTVVQVSYNGNLSAPVTVPVVATLPGLFTKPPVGTGQGAISNADGTVNSSSNPASPGDVITLYGTGEGQTNPVGVDGLVATSVLPKPVAPLSVTIGGINANVTYYGAAPGEVAGVIQINVQVPTGLQGNQPVVVKIGNTSSVNGVTIALKGTTPAAGTLTASPNPMNVCSATTAAGVTLSWTATGVTSVEVLSGSLTGAVVASGGTAGSLTLSSVPNTTYLLVNTSAGGTPTSANILSTVTLQQGTCPTQNPVAPPTTDLAQQVESWGIQYLNNGLAGAGESGDVTTGQLDGASCMFLQSITGNAITLTQNAPASGWNFSAISTISLALNADVPPGFWAAGSPSFVLLSANGTLTLSPSTSQIAGPAYLGWYSISAAIAGNSSWTATKSGQFNIADVTGIEINLQVVSGLSGWAVELNGMFLK